MGGRPPWAGQRRVHLFRRAERFRGRIHRRGRAGRRGDLYAERRQILARVPDAPVPLGHGRPSLEPPQGRLRRRHRRGLSGGRQALRGDHGEDAGAVGDAARCRMGKGAGTAFHPSPSLQCAVPTRSFRSCATACNAWARRTRGNPAQKVSACAFAHPTRENREGCDMREDVIGRANVEDTEELRSYYRELEGLGAGALWTVANTIEPWAPKSDSEPLLWRYRDLKPHVLKSVDLVTPEKAGRRVIYLSTPKRRQDTPAVGWLYTGLQVMHPGEIASAHAHSASALRFIMEGTGAYTIVDGHKIKLEVNDFVLTPNGTWHEHGVSADGTACIWQDGLDIPLMNALEANFYAVHPDVQQPVGYPIDDMSNAWGGRGLKPSTGQRSKPYSPLFKYEWGPTYEALINYAKADEGSPFDGLMMTYVNPATGGQVMQTLGASVQMLRPGQRTKAHRHTGSFIYQAVKGQGYSIVGGKRLDCQERDIFCVPSWVYHEHANASESEDACLFCFNDLPVMQALGLYREEAFGDNGGYQPL